MMDLVFLALLQLIYVPIMALRVLMMVKGYKGKVFMLGFFETAVYISGVSIVLSGEQSFLKVAVYSLSYAVGLIIGIIVEKKMAVGYTVYQVNTDEESVEILLTHLREDGFGVTKYEGQGIEGKRYKLEVLAKRADHNSVMKIVKEYGGKAFVLNYEPTFFDGGFINKDKKK